MNPEKMQQLLSELYLLDPNLKEHEKELVTILSDLLESAPQPKIDQSFVSRLRAQLTARAEGSTTVRKGFNWLNLFVPVVTAGAGAYVMFFAITSLGLFSAPKTVTPSQPATNLAQTNAPVERPKQPYIAQVMSNAYGPLNTTGAQSAPGSQVRVMENGTTVPLTGGGDDATGKLMAPSPSGTMPVYQPTRVKYVYTGDVPIPEGTVNVYRPRVDTASGDASSSLSALTLLNAQKFQNLQVQNMTINEDREFGYSITFDTSYGMQSVSIYKNWQKWPNHFVCVQNADGSEVCNPSPVLTVKDIPADDELLKLADQFVQEYGIDVSRYGSPQVDMQWQTDSRRDPAEAAYVPDEISVVYPLTLDKQEVWMEGWNARVGLRISIDLRDKKVAGASPITSQQYEASPYAVGSKEKIQSIMEQGGTYGGYGFYEEGVEVKTVEATLGEPRNVLLQISRYDDKTSTSEWLYVPALQFPVTQKPQNEEVYVPEFVFVPLAKDLLEAAPIIMYKAINSGVGGDTTVAEPGGVILPAVDPVPAPEPRPMQPVE